MSLSTQENTAVQIGAFGGKFLTGSGVHVGNFVSLESVAGAGFNITGLTAPSVGSADYLTGKAFAHPFSMNIPFTSIQLSSGVAYAKNGA